MNTTLTKAEMGQLLCSELGVNKREARQRSEERRVGKECRL